VSRTGSRVFIGGTSAIGVFDTAAHTIVGSVAVASAHRIATNPVTDRFYVSVVTPVIPLASPVYEFDASSLALIGTRTVSNRLALDLFVSRDGQRLYQATSNPLVGPNVAGFVSLFDLTTGLFVRNYSAGLYPDFAVE